MTTHRLLDIQRLDTEAEQLRHRHETLPERTRLAETEAERVRLQGEIERLGAERLEVATRQKKWEDEAQIFATKADEDDRRLYSGEVAMKDLQPLQDEIAGLRERQGDLEDRALDAMEEAESLATRQEEAEAALQRTEAAVTAAAAELAAAEAEVDGLAAGVANDRADAVAEVSADDIAAYERLRPGLGSSTVVAFDGANCVGCPSAMPAVELDRMKHADPGAVLNCTECGRIVIT